VEKAIRAGKKRDGLRWIEMDSDGSWVGWDTLVAEFALRRHVPPSQAADYQSQFSLCFFTTPGGQRRNLERGFC
jgi:hypothetical protein